MQKEPAANLAASVMPNLFAKLIERVVGTDFARTAGIFMRASF